MEMGVKAYFHQTLCQSCILCHFPSEFMNFKNLFLAIIALLTAEASWVSAAPIPAPRAPSDLKVKPIGSNSFRLEWTDRSDDEAGWQILLALKGTNPVPYGSLLGLDAVLYNGARRSAIIVIGPTLVKTLNFQVAAFKGDPAAAVYSAKTLIVKATALSGNSLRVPTKLKAKEIGDGGVILSWKDNSTSEFGYQLDYKLSKAKKWISLPLGISLSYKNIRLSGLLPDASYSFRVRAVRGNPVGLSGYSKILKVRTKPFQAPSELVVTPEGEGDFSFTWKDNSSLEAGFELESRTGDRDFAFLGTLPADSNFTNPLPGFALDTNHQFRMRAYRDITTTDQDKVVVTTKEYSDFSNVFAVKSTMLKAPTGLLVTTSTDRSVTLTWKDESARENRYEIDYRLVGAADFITVRASQDVQSYTLTDLEPSKSYEFQIRAVVYDILGFGPNRLASSSDTPLVQAQTKDGIIGRFSSTTAVNNRFLYTIQISSLSSTLTNLTVTGLPAGLSFNATSRSITGTLATTGAYTANITATFADGSSSARTLNLNSVDPQPRVGTLFGAVSVPISSTRSASLSGRFSDPDTTVATRFTTTLGVFDIILFPEATPLTFSNFNDYISGGRYADTFFHRAAAGFVVQGGGFKHTVADGVTSVVTFPTVRNEPGLSNVLGTVAMAKLGGDPNSATSQFFVNLGNNAGNLDSQNGGFTVFGRVPISQMSLFTQIDALPKGNYGSPFDNIPLNTTAPAPAVLDPTQLVKIISVGPAPVLTYQVTSANPLIATVAIVGTDVIVTGVASGNTTIQVTATDLDGQFVSQNITVTVP
jgi:cyclophilin family peptidyl-prolyl cis-trans isomerase